MLLDDLLVLRGLIHTEVVQEIAAVCDLAEESAASGVVLLMVMEVLRETANLLR